MNAKAILHEFFQKHPQLPAPTMEIQGSGYGNINVFECRLQMLGGTGYNKKEAHLNAAEAALEYLEKCGVYQEVQRNLSTTQPAPQVHVQPVAASPGKCTRQDPSDDVDDLDDVAQLREYLKRALQENQVFAAQVAGLKARQRQVVEMLTAGDPL